jgi:hypothetical protein
LKQRRQPRRTSVVEDAGAADVLPLDAVTIRGRAAHAGINPEEGASAVLELSHQVQRRMALPNAPR